MDRSSRPVDRSHGVELAEATLRRSLGIVCLLGIAAIHLMDLPDRLEELPYVGVMFLGLVLASLVLAEGLIRTDDARVWAAAGAVAAATMVGYAVSRTVGLPGDGGGDIGNWTEGLGLASLVVEGVLVLLAATRLMRSRARVPVVADEPALP